MVINFRVFLSNYFSSSVVHFKAPVPYHSTATAHILTAMILFPHEVLSSESGWGVSYIIPSWAVVLFPHRVLYLDLESWGICIHLFPLHLLFLCWVAKSFTSNHLSSLQNQHPAFLKTHSKSLIIVCTVFTRDSTWLSLFPNSFKSSINNWWFNHCISYDVAFI